MRVCILAAFLSLFALLACVPARGGHGLADADAAVAAVDGAVSVATSPADAAAVVDAAPDANVPVASDFTPVLEGCAPRLFHVGTDVVVVAPMQRDGKVFATVATWNDGAATFEHLATAGPLEFDDPGLDISVDGPRASQMTVTLDYHCAPDLESKGGQFTCFRAELGRRDDTLRIVHKPRNIHTGGYVERNYAPPGTAIDPLARAWLGKHPGCELRTSSRHVSVEHGTLDYDFGCPTPSPKAGATCTEDCMILWRGPGGAVQTAPFDGMGEMFPVPGKGVFVYGTSTKSLAPHAVFVDASGAHDAALPKGTSSSSSPLVAGESIFVEADDVTYEAKGPPSLTFTPACPAGVPSCRFFDDPREPRDGRGPRYVFAVKDGAPTRLLRRDGAAWSTFTLPSGASSPRLSQRDALWLESEPAADTSTTLWRLGKTNARYRCTSAGPHVIERIP